MPTPKETDDPALDNDVLWETWYDSEVLPVDARAAHKNRKAHRAEKAGHLRKERAKRRKANRIEIEARNAQRRAPIATKDSEK
jgi:hypothetical protein